jgi:hypothetical protein
MRRRTFVKGAALLLGQDGNTADYNPVDETYATAGLRFWF